MGIQLGKGDVGKAFLVHEPSTPDKKFVLKEIKLRTEKDAIQFQLEVSTGYVLGAQKIAPQIYDCWVYTTPRKIIGYYTMDLMDAVYANKYPGSVKDYHRSEIRDENVRLAKPPLRLEQGIIRALETMIDAGFVHNDNHPGNIGIIHGKVVLFDFGFTSYIGKDLSKEVKTLLLGFSLYQVVEKYDTDIMHASYIYSLLCDIQHGRYKFGDELPAPSISTAVQECKPSYDAPAESWAAKYPDRTDVYMHNPGWVKDQRKLIRAIKTSVQENRVPLSCSPYEIRVTMDGAIVLPPTLFISIPNNAIRTYVEAFCYYQVIINSNDTPYSTVMYENENLLYTQIYSIRKSIPVIVKHKVLRAFKKIRIIQAMRKKSSARSLRVIIPRSRSPRSRSRSPRSRSPRSRSPRSSRSPRGTSASTVSSASSSSARGRSFSRSPRRSPRRFTRSHSVENTSSSRRTHFFRETPTSIPRKSKLVVDRS